ncbi:MAG: nickel pincer cofactor biosynthesis protein LarC [bacterium]|nr:nickel pincer cofactor biosynthesis protein LarC [bacterium]
MKIAYFDCFSGISGDMIIGALLDTGQDIAALRAELDKLGLSGFSVDSRKVEKNGILGTKFDVNVPEKPEPRRWTGIKLLIEESSLDDEVRETALRIFENLAGAEAEVHGIPVEKVHFHEVGAIDSIVDIVGIAITLKLMDIDGVYASKVHVGSGFVECEHGIFPVPAPATIKLLEGKPIYSTGIGAELVTPTGAAVITTLAADFGDIPQMTVSSVGYGAGSRDLPIANLLRVIIGERAMDGYERDEVVLIETNLDDVSAEIISFTVEKLLKNGALDVYTSPIYMKKNRPATKLSVIADANDTDRLSDIIFEQTSTFGIRLQNFGRKKLKRRIETVETEFGPARVKVGEVGGRVLNVVPEYEDCKRISEERDVEFHLVYDEVKKAGKDKFGT